MSERRNWSIGILALITAAFFLIYSAVQYNLAATAAALASQPVTVILDAGHGGEDGGASSDSGVQESQLNLAITLRLEQLLTLCGMQTYMIRSTDTAIYSGNCSTITEKKVSDLKNRVKIVNSISPAILLSIHQNHFSEPKYDGAQVFYADTDGSKLLAQQTQEMLRSVLDPGNRREIKRADTVYLMEHIICTGILVECGFLSNPKEAMRLQEDEYQKKLVCAVGCGLAQFLEKGETGVEI